MDARILVVITAIIETSTSSEPAELQCWQRLSENGRLLKGTPNTTVTCTSTQFCARAQQTLTVYVALVLY
jgi:hypothetical protein